MKFFMTPTAPLEQKANGMDILQSMPKGMERDSPAFNGWKVLALMAMMQGTGAVRGDDKMFAPASVGRTIPNLADYSPTQVGIFARFGKDAWNAVEKQSPWALEAVLGRLYRFMDLLQTAEGAAKFAAFSELDM
jgi:hypothetical protein